MAKTINRYIDRDGLKHYHDKAQEDLERRGYQDDGDVKATVKYYHEHDAKDAFVAKENGKGLSTNDFTNEEKQKLAGLDNVVPEGLTAEQIAKINASITQSDLDNGKYQTEESVNNLITSAKQEITERGYQTENDVRALLASSQHLQRKLVTSSDDIDVTATDAEKYIYLVPLYTDNDTFYSEWLVVDGKAVMVSNGFTNLDGYWQKGELEVLTTSEIEEILI